MILERFKVPAKDIVRVPEAALRRTVISRMIESIATRCPPWAMKLTRDSTVRSSPPRLCTVASNAGGIESARKTCAYSAAAPSRWSGGKMTQNGWATRSSAAKPYSAQ